MDNGIRIGLAGAAVGVGATFAMSGMMLAARRAGLMSRHPPEEIVDRSAERLTGRRLPEPQRRVIGTAAHLGFGALGGAAFGGAWSAARPSWPAALAGLAYGTAIWAASYLGWVPALGLMPRADEDETPRPIVMVLAHWVYGLVLGATIDRLTVSHTPRARALT